MYGAILGDIVGSPYEFDCNNYKAKDFPLFSRRSDFTDDTVMTLAVAKALLSSRGQDDTAIKRHWCGRCSDWAAAIPTGVTVRGLAVGYMRMLHSPTIAMAMEALCEFLLRRGWRRIWRRRCIWRSSPPR